MRNSIIAALSKLNNILLKRRGLRTAVSVLSCVVVFVVTYLMIIPAVTMEYKANEDELSTIDMPMLLSDGDETVVYSSDLEDFVVSMDITNADGTSIEGSIVAIDTDYILTITFTESDLLQMEVNEDGVLTYQLPEALRTVPCSNDIYINGNVVIGTYEIDSNGVLSITPHNVDVRGNTTEDSFIDNYQNTSISISFNAQVTNDGGPGAVSINLGNNVSVDLVVKENGKLETEKKRVNIDYVNHRMYYEFTVKAVNADVNNVVLYDLAKRNQYFDFDNFTITGPDGTDITNQFTEITPTPATPKTASQTQQFPDASEGFPYTNCANLPSNPYEIAFFAYANGSYVNTEIYAILGTVHEGETYKFSYSVPIEDTAYESNGNVRLDNTITASGINTDNDPVTDSSTVDSSVSFVRLSKNGSTAKLSNNDVATWTVTIGNGETEVGQHTITDTLSANQTYLTSQPIKVSYKDLNTGATNTVNVNWTDSHVNIITNADGTQSFTLDLPVGSESASYYNIQYYTDYTLTSVKDNIRNTVSDDAYNASASKNVVVTFAKPEISKKGNISEDGNSFHFEITADIPAGVNLFDDFHIEDCLQFRGNAVTNDWWYEDAEWSNVVIEVTGESGTVYNLTPYESGDPTGTYLHIKMPGGYNNNHHIYFNTTDKDSPSTWGIAEHCTLVLKYDIPLDCTLVRAINTNNYITNEDYTSMHLLENDATLINWVSIYYDSIQAGTSTTVNINTKKTSTVNEDGSIEYSVAFDPRKGSNESYLPYTRVSAGDRVYITNFTFVDEFDENLLYVDNSLKIKVYQPSVNAYAIFDYTGDASAFNTNHKIVANASDFVVNDALTTNWMNGSWAKRMGFTKLSDFFNGQVGPRDYTYTAIYDTTLDEEAAQQVASRIIVDNDGWFQWDGGITNNAHNTTAIDTGLMSKEFVQNGDKLDYTILLNPTRKDLLEDNDTIKIQDTMSDNLSVYWDSIKVYYYDDTDGWIDMDSADSEYTCTRSFNPDSNMLTFEVPDSQYLKFTYTTLITATGQVSVNNTVALVGYGDVVKASEAQFSVAKSGGTASAGNIGFTIAKSSTNGDMLPNAAFAIYTDNPAPADADDNPYNAPPSFTVQDAYGGTVTLTYYKTYVTGEDGTIYADSQYFLDDHTYAVYEAKAPNGYKALTEPIVFNLNPNAIEREIDMQQVSNMLSIVNTPFGYVLPSTGGIGSAVFYIAGAFLMLTGTAIVIKKKKTENGGSS